MKDATLITVLLDRSGSMGSIVNDVIGGYNNFLNEQKGVSGECRLTLVQFDSEAIDTLYEYADVHTVPELTKATYQPRAATPLLAALGKTIKSTGRALENMNAEDRPDKVLFVVITDGEENDTPSFREPEHRYTKAQIKDMIEHQEKVYGWNFIFLGANQDAFAEAGAVGMNVAMAANFAPTGQSVRAAYAGMSANAVRYRGSSNSADLHWSDTQRQAMVDDTDFTAVGGNTRRNTTQPPKSQRLNWQRRGKK